MNQNERESVKQWYSDNFEEIKGFVSALKELPNQHPEHYAKFVGRQKKLGGTAPTLEAIDPSALVGEFCKDWPLVEKALNTALPFLSFLSGLVPGIGILLKFVPIVQKMVDNTLVPLVCAA